MNEKPKNSMINVRELSTGNLLSHEGNIIKIHMINTYGNDETVEPRVMAKANNQIDRYIYNLSEVEPIHLTDEIIMLCGFVYSDGLEYYKIDYDSKYELKRYTLKKMSDKYYLMLSRREYKNGFKCQFIDLHPVQYLHELQNSFYWATRDDLDVSRLLYNKVNKNALETIYESHAKKH